LALAPCPTISPRDQPLADSSARQASPDQQGYPPPGGPMSEAHETVESPRQPLTANEAEAIATLGYLFGYPLVLMDRTCTFMHEGTNRFDHFESFPDATRKDVVSPNVDTLYSSAWLDLSKEPIVLSVPDTGKRFYMMQMLDAWTNVIASPGTRTTGNGK